MFIPLNKRADITNTAKADLFVSIHMMRIPQCIWGSTFCWVFMKMIEILELLEENSVIFLEEDYEKNYDGFDLTTQNLS